MKSNNKLLLTEPKPFTFATDSRVRNVTVTTDRKVERSKPKPVVAVGLTKVLPTLLVMAFRLPCVSKVESRRRRQKLLKRRKVHVLWKRPSQTKKMCLNSRLDLWMNPYFMVQYVTIIRNVLIHS